MAPSTVFLDLLGPQRASEKGTTCPGDLPPASDPELVERARAARAVLRPRCWSGRNSTRSARSNAQAIAVAAFEEVQMAPPSRPVKALIAAEEFM